MLNFKKMQNGLA